MEKGRRGERETGVPTEVSPLVRYALSVEMTFLGSEHDKEGVSPAPFPPCSPASFGHGDGMNSCAAADVNDGGGRP